MSVVIFFLACFIIGLAKACRDTIAHHFKESIFNVKNPKLNKWFRSDPKEWPLYFGLIRLDAWHTFELILYAGVALLVGGQAYYKDMDWTSGITSIAVIAFVFIVFYKKYLLKGNSNESRVRKVSK